MTCPKLPLVASLLLASLAAAQPATKPVVPPHVGDDARALSLDTLDGQHVDLAELEKSGPVVVIQLRGWVGYQCPLCTKQVGDFLASAGKLAAARATVILVYPGPATDLKSHADEFISGKTLPANFRFALDPDLKFVSAWGLRWNAKDETAYPATFLVDGKNKVRFASVSHSHAGRASANEVLTALGNL